MPRRGYRFIGPVVTEAQKGIKAPPRQVETMRDPAPPTPQGDAEHRKPLPIAVAAHPPERRRLTIMQCAMSGPAFQSAGRDPEDLHRLLTAFHESCAAIIAKAGGGVARLLNDGILAYFGYPQADEHQAERAIRVGRALVQASGRADECQAHGVQARVAIATGHVLVGDLFRDLGEQAVLGAPASLAAGLVAHAPSGTVLISATTRRLVGELFQCEECGPIALPGFSEVIEVWHVVGEGAAEDRFEALRGRRVAALVGREEELALSLRRWDRAKEGEGRVVLLSGEAGIGKSRILAELARADRRRAACDDALPVLAASRQRRLLSDHEPDLARGGSCRRRAGRRAARQAGGDDRPLGTGGDGHRAIPRVPALDPLRGPLSPRSKWRRANRKSGRSRR